MQHCLLALHQKEQYLSACHYCWDLADLGYELNRKYATPEAAEDFILSHTMGLHDDLCIHRLPLGHDRSSHSATPVLHKDPIRLIEHAISVKATHIICFEGGRWSEIPIAKIDIDETERSYTERSYEVA